LSCCETRPRSYGEEDDEIGRWRVTGCENPALLAASSIMGWTEET
jgi:hypothetical protein